LKSLKRETKAKEKEDDVRKKFTVYLTLVN